MTPSDTPHQPVPGRDDGDEVDPTGIRDLLRSLPDPGPMPEELVRRIETRLAVELAHRAPSHPFTDEPVDPSGSSVVDLATERARRRPRWTILLLGTAAAGVLVATVTVGDLFGSGVVGGADTAAYAPASERPAVGDAAGGGADDQAEEDAEAAGGDSEGDDSAGGADGGAPAQLGDAPGVAVLADLGEVEEAALAALVSEAVRAAADEDSAPTLSAAQAKSCWETIAVNGTWQDLHAASASMDDDPVVVLWASDDTGRGHAWLVPGECVVNPSVAPLADVALAP